MQQPGKNQHRASASVVSSHVQVEVVILPRLPLNCHHHIASLFNEDKVRALANGIQARLHIIIVLFRAI